MLAAIASTQQQSFIGERGSAAILVCCQLLAQHHSECAASVPQTTFLELTRFRGHFSMMG